MSNQEDISNPSWKDRVKPHVKTAVISFGAGVALTVAVVRRIPIGSVEGVWFHPALIKQLTEHGGAVIKVPKTGRIVDIIDWSHPVTEAKGLAK